MTVYHRPMNKYYETRAQSMTMTELAYAIRDISDTLSVWRDCGPTYQDYINKLLAEFDAYTVEFHRRKPLFA